MPEVFRILEPGEHVIRLQMIDINDQSCIHRSMVVVYGQVFREFKMAANGYGYQIEILAMGQKDEQRTNLADG